MPIIFDFDSNSFSIHCDDVRECLTGEHTFMNTGPYNFDAICTNFRVMNFGIVSGAIESSLELTLCCRGYFMSPKQFNMTVENVDI